MQKHCFNDWNYKEKSSTEKLEQNHHYRIYNQNSVSQQLADELQLTKQLNQFLPIHNIPNMLLSLWIKWPCLSVPNFWLNLFQI